MAYPASPSIADRMRVVDFAASLQKQEPAGGEGGAQMAAMPAPVTPPAAPPTPPMGGPAPEDMDAMVPTAEVPIYADNTEAFLDFKQKMTDLSLAVTGHMNTASQPVYTENQDSQVVNMFIEGLRVFRERVEECDNILTKVGQLNPEVMGDTGGMPPEMGGPPPGMGGPPPGLMNMPGPGPAGMPPGALANAGPMGGP